MAAQICDETERATAPGASTDRSLAAFIGSRARAAGAQFHLLLRSQAPAGGRRIVLCNWLYDAVTAVGVEALAHVAQSAAACLPGRAARGFHPLALAALVEREEIAELAHHGHQEIFVLALPVGQARWHLMLSAGQPGRIDDTALPALQMACCYALSSSLPHGAPREANPLSRRELECLSWVSEGKTADEVALILGISPNTVNSQVAHAIHKLQARNRAMAIATAIRRGLI
ncbi:helix-turn-helix transcriptional regulator [Chelativorans intermedius]|uniref:LuxR C-terminal-related transcriptional regulator n=1 Tax=Chelativorans intermedius TaxID=515947 RepID=A0ABV6D8R2_9HYPH|nr:helix-turn-helix transcriptional regulator [Chelativorans intermedius]MCT8997801.1 helix-turn-helix transcriptional regulator [Chelativorans intermedius]